MSDGGKTPAQLALTMLYVDYRFLENLLGGLTGAVHIIGPPGGGGGLMGSPL